MNAHTRLLTVLAVLSFTACPPTYPKCESDQGCSEHGEVCVQGQCRECATDANCKEGFVCRENKCAPKPAAAPAVSAVTAPPAPKTCTRDDDCPSNQLCAHGVCADISADMPECGGLRVHFAFDSAALPDDRAGLARMARCVRADLSLHVTIEGNADERGTEEYNLLLSQRRAVAVEKYLQDLGASAKQLDSIGYGFERPLCKTHDEECWAKNRRAGVKPVKK